MFNTCNAALQSGLPLTVGADRRESVDWLIAHDLAALTSEGKMVLLSSCVRNVTHLAAPTLVTHDDQANSTWGLRKKLEDAGWSSVKPSQAMATDRTFNGNNGMKSYLCLLLARR